MKHLWKQRIKQEYEAPARVVIRSFADSGYSKRLTAACVGITTQTLLRYCREQGIEFRPQRDMRPECKPKGRGWVKGRKRKIDLFYQPEVVRT